MPTIRQRFPQPKVKINLMARFNSNHYGYASDLIQGILNTAVFSITSFKFGHSNAAIVARYVDENGNPLIPNQTMCSNLDESNRIFGPYYDEVIPEQLVDRIEYIDNTNDTVTTIIS
jgi:hypothetical protein